MHKSHSFESNNQESLPVPRIPKHSNNYPYSILIQNTSYHLDRSFLIILPILVNSHDAFIHILQDCFTSTEAIIWQQTHDCPSGSEITSEDMGKSIILARPSVNVTVNNIELGITIYVIASQLSGRCDCISNRLWRHQQNEIRAS